MRRKSTLKSRARAQRQLATPQSPPGRASDYILHAKRLRLRGLLTRVVLYLRVSSGPQDSAGNLDVQLARLERYAAKYGITILACFRDVGSGWAFEASLVLATAAAQARKAGAVLLATSTDRFLRSETFHTAKHPDAQPTVAEYERFKAHIGDVTVATLLPPDMPWRAVRGRQAKWGQQAKGRKGGRPRATKPGDKKAIRFKSKAIKLALILKDEHPDYSDRKIRREIGEVLGRSPETIRCWIGDWIKD